MLGSCVFDKKIKHCNIVALLLHSLSSVFVLRCGLQMQVVEELHLARSEKRLEVDVLHSCGELTCMDIDPPEEGAANSHCKCTFLFVFVCLFSRRWNIHFYLFCNFDIAKYRICTNMCILLFQIHNPFSRTSSLF